MKMKRPNFLHKKKHLNGNIYIFRLAKKEIRHLENELGRWQVLVDSVTGISPPDFDNQTLAVLRGRLVRYLMRSREVSSHLTSRVDSFCVLLALVVIYL